MEQAHELWRQVQQRLNALEQAIQQPEPQSPAQTPHMLGPVHHYRIRVNGKVYETSIQVVSQ